MSISKVSIGIKVVIKSETLLGRVQDTNDDINDTEFDKVAITSGFKKKVGIWLIRIVIIASGESTKDVAFIIVPIVSIGSISIGVVDIV